MKENIMNSSQVYKVEQKDDSLRIFESLSDVCIFLRQNNIENATFKVFDNYTLVKIPDWKETRENYQKQKLETLRKWGYS